MNAFSVSGMTCAGCARKVEGVLKTVAPSATVTLEPPRAVMDEMVPAETLNAALAGVGNYRATAEAQASSASPEVSDSNGLKIYYPLFLVVGLIAVGSLAGPGWMLNFMGGFFLVFGAFKLLDVPAFANAYARYDVIAKAFKPWGYAYPLIETALGLAFLFRFQIPTMLWVALVLSLIGAIGVIQANLRKETIQCACLGTVFQLPMSVVTIIESLGMAITAAGMLAAA
jgi:copper chaperone CopZ